jgi:quercetin dioxygenase-like cupin family protein
MEADKRRKVESAKRLSEIAKDNGLRAKEKDIMYFFGLDELKEKEIAPNVKIRTLSGEKMMISYVTLAPYSEVPLHHHPHEQVGIILEGELEFTIGNETRICKKGDTYIIPGGVMHGVKVFDKPAVAMDIFSPPREEYK